MKAIAQQQQQQLRAAQAGPRQQCPARLPQPGAADHEAMWSIVPWSAGPALPAGSLPTFLCTPGQVGWGAEKAWTLCSLCSAVTKTSWSYQLCSQHKSKIPPHTAKKRNPVPAKTNLSQLNANFILWENWFMGRREYFSKLMSSVASK